MHACLGEVRSTTPEMKMHFINLNFNVAEISLRN